MSNGGLTLSFVLKLVLSYLNLLYSKLDISRDHLKPEIPAQIVEETSQLEVITKNKRGNITYPLARYAFAYGFFSSFVVVAD